MSKLFSKIRFVIAIAAGKGGVGKSSLTVNLALALKEMGYAVGVLDADLYGPSLGHMMPLESLLKKDEESNKYFIPGEFCGIKVFSLSHIRPDNQSMSVRAPVVNGLLLQITKQVLWGELDYLLVDFPPGTGDIQLTLLQSMPFSGAVILTLPSEVSVIDVKKTMRMFEQLQVPILGVIENMSYFSESPDAKKHYLFGQGGGSKLAEAFGVSFLGEVPMDPSLCKAMDEGENFMQKQKNGITALEICKITNKIQKNLFALEAVQGEHLKEFSLVWENV